jgi:hypothetical protein
MRLFSFPTQDASIYEAFPTRNTGLDEILEVGKTDDGIHRVRSLVQFDIATISASLANGTIPASAQFDFNLNIASAESLQLGQILSVSPVSQSWTEGSGYFYQEAIQAFDGVSWRYSRSGSAWAASGSDVIAGSVSVALANPLTDLTLDITSYVRAWVSGTVPNNGMEIQFVSSSESRPDNWGNIKFFSKDTHTIYRPTLVTKWNDQTRVTGSLTPTPTTDLLVIPSTLKPTYRPNDVARVNVAARKRYPVKSFSTQFTQYNGLNYLPATSYFSIVDDLSGKVIIPFDDASRLSCDSEGNYFVFHVQNMYPQRYYRVIIKVDHDGVTDTFDDGFLFTVK